MKVLLDSCVWGRARFELIEAGVDCVWAGCFEKDPGDEEIINLAVEQGRVLVTLDKDFGELIFVKLMFHCGLIRLVNIPSLGQAKRCLEIINRYEVQLSKGAIITTTIDKIRV